ncbi:MAG: hypothetical protein KKF44_06140 [Nanoarchaeota archaeon]|nr:hypothetical protein [Nanoarchaeota archaeon]
MIFKSKKRTLFLSLSTIGMEIVSAEDSIAAAYIQKKILSSNFSYDIDFLPKKNIPYFEFDKYLRSLDFKKFSLLMVSMTTFSYPYIRKLNEHIRKKHPKLPIIAGGAHFQNENTAEKAIKNDLVDIVIIGSIDSFIRFMRDYEKKNLVFRSQKKSIFLYAKSGQVSENIFYRDVRGGISGKVSRKYNIITTPLIISKKGEIGIETELLLNNFCPNGCDYCNSPKDLIIVPVKDYIDEINAKAKQENITRISLYDNNPLWKKNRKRTLEFFDEFNSEFGRLPSTVLYMDPSHLVEDYDELAGIYKKYLTGRNNHLFFGRETVDEGIAEKIGRKYCGIVRKQDELDKEKQALIRLAEELNKNFTIVINYILTPFENNESIAKLLDEARLFSQYKHVIVRSNLLWPLPGTKVEKRFGGQFVQPDELDVDLKYFNLGGINFWESEFLDICFALKARIDFSHFDPYFSFYSFAMVELAGKIVFGEYEKKKTIKIIIGKIPKGLSLLSDKIREFGKRVDDEKLYEVNRKNKMKIMQYSHSMLLNFPDEVAVDLAEEFGRIMDAKEKWFVAGK